MTTLQEYYHELSNTEWVRYLFYVILIVFSMVTLYKVLPEQHNGSGFEIDDDVTHADQDRKYLYTISDGKVAKYKRKSGKKKLEKNVSFSNMIGIKKVGGNLIILNSANERTMVIVMCPKTLKVTDHFVIPDLATTIKWFDMYDGKMWLYGSGILFCFDSDWELIGFWKFPKHIKHPKYGYWYEDLFYTGDANVQYALELPEDKVEARIVESSPTPRVPICFMGIERIGGRTALFEDHASDVEDYLDD